MVSDEEVLVEELPDPVLPLIPPWVNSLWLADTGSQVFGPSFLHSTLILGL